MTRCWVISSVYRNEHEVGEALQARLLAAMTEHPLSPVIFMLESIQGGGEHFRKLGMPSPYSRPG